MVHQPAKVQAVARICLLFLLAGVVLRSAGCAPRMGSKTVARLSRSPLNQRGPTPTSPS